MDPGNAITAEGRAITAEEMGLRITDLFRELNSLEVSHVKSLRRSPYLSEAIPVGGSGETNGMRKMAFGFSGSGKVDPYPE